MSKHQTIVESMVDEVLSGGDPKQVVEAIFENHSGLLTEKTMDPKAAVRYMRSLMSKTKAKKMISRATGKNELVHFDPTGGTGMGMEQAWLTKVGSKYAWLGEDGELWVYEGVDKKFDTPEEAMKAASEIV